MSDDKTTIGLTPQNREVMEKIVDNFNDRIEAARFAMALAIKSGKTPSKLDNAETVWNVGSFDPEGEIRDLIKALFPDNDSPYRATEYFINEGLQIIDGHLEDNKNLDVVQLI